MIFLLRLLPYAVVLGGGAYLALKARGFLEDLGPKLPDWDDLNPFKDDEPETPVFDEDELEYIEDIIEEQSQAMVDQTQGAGINQNSDLYYKGGNGWYYFANPTVWWIGSDEGRAGANALGALFNNRRSESTEGERIVNGLTKKYGPQGSRKAYAGKIEHPQDYYKMMAALLKWGDLSARDLGIEGDKINAFVNDWNWSQTSDDRQGFAGLALPTSAGKGFPYFRNSRKTTTASASFKRAAARWKQG